ncbi:MAG: ABC transporter substrate-binding protein, partial [Ruminiclostridium sp.]
MVVLAGVFTGCGTVNTDSTVSTGTSSSSAKSGTSGDKVKLTFYCNAVVKNDTPDIIAEFNKENPNITVEYVELPADATKKNQTLSTILQAKDKSMDLFLVDTTWPESYTASGWLEPMDDVLTEKERSEYMQNPLGACTIDGHLMALPVFMDAGVLLYRKDLLEKYNYEAPKTWDEMTEQAKNIMSKEKNVAGFVSSWKQYENLTCTALEFVKSYGGDIVDDKGNVKIGTKESGQGIQKMYDMIFKDKITEQGINGYTVPDAAAIFNSGNSAFFRAWPSNYVQANNKEVSSVVGKVGVTSLPAGPDGSYSCLGGWSIGVSPFSAHKEEAKKFAKYFSGAKANKIRALAGGNLPVIQSVYEDAEVKKAMPQFEYLKPCADNAAARPKSAYYEEVSAAVQQGVGSVLTGTSKVEDAQKIMQKQIEEIMSR